MPFVQWCFATQMVSFYLLLELDPPKPELPEEPELPDEPDEPELLEPGLLLEPEEPVLSL